MDNTESTSKKPTPNQIFRSVSLERLSNPEQLDSLLTVVTPKKWIALACMLMLGCVVLLWAFFGSIPVKIEGKGIVMNQKGFLFNIPTKMGGTVQQIHVKPNDQVEEGTLIAQIFDAEENLKLDRADLRVVNLTRDLQRLRDEVAVEAQAQSEAQESEIAAKKYNIEQLDRRIEDLKKEVEVRRKLYEDGLVSHSVLIDTEDRLSKSRIEKEVTGAAIATLRFNLAKGYRTEEVKAKEQELFKATEARDLLRTRQPYYNIYSSTTGNVLALLASEGDVVQPGAPLVWVEYKGAETSYVVYGYFPVEKGKRIEIGFKVQVAVSTVDTQEYGYLTGTVKEVSGYAVSKNSIAKIVHNTELVEYLSQGVPAVVQVLIELETDPITHNYRWTSGKTPPVKISTGTVCTLQAILHRIRPIHYVLPIETFKIAKTP
ncbi:MAG: HlyD family efflux transporter periplasmic adaptor subunit [Parachlamydiaceae bacterium]|nr:HlyD family efflux transporter periplasmic adaptor subunit [Parachlamydiaceae bacterium]